MYQTNIMHENCFEVPIAIIFGSAVHLFHGILTYWGTCTLNKYVLLYLGTGNK